jgi:hypothetical protein
MPFWIDVITMLTRFCDLGRYLCFKKNKRLVNRLGQYPPGDAISSTRIWHAQRHRPQTAPGLLLFFQTVNISIVTTTVFQFEVLILIYPELQVRFLLSLGQQFNLLKTSLITSSS